MKKIAKKSTPENNSISINVLTLAQKLITSIKDYSKMFGYNDIGSLTTLERDINRSVKGKEKNRIYAGEGMTGILNIGMKKGKEKDVQEDSILMLSHPKNKNFRIALVADGVGGQGNGDVASYIATVLTANWFKRLPENFYNSDKITLKYQDGSRINLTFEDMVKQHLIDVNDKITKQLGPLPGTTFSAAITRNKKGRDTVTSISIGDSKILRVSENGEVSQLSKDDNILSEAIENRSLYVSDNDYRTIYTSDPTYTSLDIVYKPIKSASGVHILNESDTRFYKRNNLITGFLGCGQSNEKLKNKLDENKNNYITEWDFNKGDKIMLCSDGVADNLSNPEIGSLMYTFRNADECLKNIVNVIYDIENKKVRNRTNNPPEYLKNNDNFNKVLKGSGDNISAVIIDNERGEM